MARANEVIIRDRNGVALDVTSYNGQVSIPVVAGMRNVNVVTKSVTGAATSDGYMLVDLSNGSGSWPHGTSKLRVDLQWINAHIMPSSDFMGNISIAGISAVDSGAASLKSIFDYQMSQAAAPVTSRLEFPMGGILRGDFNNWTGPQVDSVAVFQLGVSSLQGPDNGYYMAGSGDIVMNLTVNSGTVDVSLCLAYTTI